jgi:peptidoglycan/xylan/chitin deacetylase (PgdA/CDA1 family)
MKRVITVVLLSTSIVRADSLVEFAEQWLCESDCTYDYTGDSNVNLRDFAVIAVMGALTWNTVAAVDPPLRTVSGDAIYQDYMDDITKWTGSNCDITEDTTYVQYWNTAKKSMKITATAGTSCTATCTLAETIDLSQYELLVNFHMDSANRTKATQFIVTYGVTDLGGRRDNYVWLPGSFPSFIPNGDWFKIRHTIYSGDGAGTLATSINSVAKLQFKLAYTAGNYPEVTVDYLAFPKKQPIANVAITFDDGKAEDFTVAQYLATRGIRATFYVITGSMNTDGFLTTAQLTQMQAWGHLIANHTSAHTYYPTSLAPATAISELRTASNWLRDNGFSRGARIYALPGGTNNIMNWSENPSTIQGEYDLIRASASTIILQEPVFIPNVGKVVYTSWFDNTSSPNTTIGNSSILGYSPFFCLGYHTGTTGSFSVTDSQGAITSGFTTLVNTIVTQKNAGLLKDITMDELAYGTPVVRYESDGRARYDFTTTYKTLN